MDSNWKQLLEAEVDVLRQGRDDLKLQIHLGAADARDAWDKVEKNWGHLEARLKVIGKAGQESASDVEDAAKLFLVEEIKTSYQNIKNLL